MNNFIVIIYYYIITMNITNMSSINHINIFDQSSRVNATIYLICDKIIKLDLTIYNSTIMQRRNQILNNSVDNLKKKRIFNQI